MGACCTLPPKNYIGTTNTTEPPITHHSNSLSCHNYKECSSLLRLSEILQHYALLNPFNNPQQQDAFTKYMTTKQPNVLDDYIHFIRHHQHEIEDIQNEFLKNRGFTKCHITNCNCTSRHHRVVGNSFSHNEDNILFNFFAETIDSLHFYIFHIFDVGLRIPSRPKDYNSNHDEKGNIDITSGKGEFFDPEFAEIRQRINEKGANTNSFERFGKQGNDSKFSINIQYQDEQMEEEKANGNQQEPGCTYLDSIYDHLQNMNFDDGLINNLKKFLDLEDFDTESVSMDIVDDGGKNGNIMEVTQNDQCIVAINKLIANDLRMLINLYLKCRLIIICYGLQRLDLFF